MPGGPRKSTRRNMVRRGKRFTKRKSRRPTLSAKTVLYPSAALRRAATVTTNAIRRFNLAPAKITNGAVNGKWWFESLKAIGFIIMRIVAIAVSADYIEELLRKHPIEGCRFDLVAGAIPCGAITKIGFGPEDLLCESAFVTVESAGVGKGHFRQARIKWVNFIINPPADVTSRGGMIAAALLPVTRHQYIEDLSVVNSEHFTMRELLSIPGVIYKSAATPTVLRYNPRANEFAGQWMQFGSQNKNNRTGGDVCVYLCVCYHDMAADDQSTVTTKMTPSHALLDLAVESRVQLREYDEEVMIRTQPPILTPSIAVSVSNFNEHRLVAADDVLVHQGVLVFEDPVLTMSE